MTPKYLKRTDRSLGPRLGQWPPGAAGYRPEYTKEPGTKLRRETETVNLLVVLIVSLDIGQKALARGLLGSLAEGVLVSPWKGIEMSFDRRLQSAAMA
jgi:hypothetical protein